MKAFLFSGTMVLISGFFECAALPTTASLEKLEAQLSSPYKGDLGGTGQGRVRIQGNRPDLPKLIDSRITDYDEWRRSLGQLCWNEYKRDEHLDEKRSYKDFLERKISETGDVPIIPNNKEARNQLQIDIDQSFVACKKAFRFSLSKEEECRQENTYKDGYTTITPRTAQSSQSDREDKTNQLLKKFGDFINKVKPSEQRSKYKSPGTPAPPRPFPLPPRPI